MKKVEMIKLANIVKRLVDTKQYENLTLLTDLFYKHGIKGRVWKKKPKDNEQLKWLMDTTMLLIMNKDSEGLNRLYADYKIKED